MALTTSQIFQIGTAVVGFGCVVAPFLGADPKAVTVIGGAVAALWGTIGTIITTPNAQVQSVANRIDDPAVKSQILPAVANLAGVKTLLIDLSKADATVLGLAASTAQVNSKIEAAK